MRDRRFRVIWCCEIILTGLLVGVFCPGMLMWWMACALMPLGLLVPLIIDVECSVCDTGTQNQSSISVTVAGVVNGLGCSDCANLNRTWTVFWVGPSNACSYRSATGPVVVCGVSTNFVDVAFGLASTGVLRVQVTDKVPGGTTPAYDSADLGTPQDCSDDTGLSGLTTSSSTLNCNYNSSTVTVVR